MYPHHNNNTKRKTNGKEKRGKQFFSLNEDRFPMWAAVHNHNL
jgi:hypothetical protein